MTTQQKLKKLLNGQEIRPFYYTVKQLNKLPVKIYPLDIKGLEKIKAVNIKKANAFYRTCPFATNVYIALKTKLPASFIKENEKEIRIN